jgi:hypothetical protein
MIPKNKEIDVAAEGLSGYSIITTIKIVDGKLYRYKYRMKAFTSRRELLSSEYYDEQSFKNGTSYDGWVK